MDSVGNIFCGKQQGRIAGQVLAWAAAGLGAEAADEMALLAGALDAAAAHVAQRAGARAATEQALQMEATATGSLRQLGHPQRL
ncbi:hypothetical protein G6F64_015308 [Rhizopus arrhizus]|uniref:Uncharacterized protein n=1 Tax=Rhizopus oryzae TaxID=64495 RepID=A0A9P6WSC4_RHIOR|nr:hypothetical protein G6F64_015308 [Rhizopus arrhizus]